MTQKYYITTTIPYVNAAPHLGHALELVQADITARFHRLVGHNVTFQTGTDENAFKNVLAAENEGIEPTEYVKRNSEQFRCLVQELQITTDTFIRTSGSYHRLATEIFWDNISPNDLYQGTYEGLYCQGCEEFVTEASLTDGLCPEHNAPPQAVSENNWFFRLSHYADKLLQLIETGSIRIVPESRRNEVINFIGRGLTDICVSRNASRSNGWGIRVPGDHTQVIYVWIDALINYISGQGYGSRPEDEHLWRPGIEKIHILGKNVWKFHAVYWPALLLSVGLTPPDTLFVHGFITAEGKKISKTLGNGIDPQTIIREFGSDPLRWYLAADVSPYADGDFSEERFHAAYNGILASGIGNIANRILVLCERANIPGITSQEHRLPEEITDKYGSFIWQFSFDKYTQAIKKEIDRMNRAFQLQQPWKRPDSAGPELHRHSLIAWRDQLAILAQIIGPILPTASAKIIDALSGDYVKKTDQLFPRK